jgi:hypothetical protein
MRSVVLLVSSILISQVSGAGQTAAIPSGSVSVAYRQLEQGELSESVHELTLSCWEGQCTLSTLTLNQCLPSSNGPAFVPKVQRSSTADRTLMIRGEGPDVLRAEKRSMEPSSSTASHISLAALLRRSRRRLAFLRAPR